MCSVPGVALGLVDGPADGLALTHRLLVALLLQAVPAHLHRLRRDLHTRRSGLVIPN